MHDSRDKDKEFVDDWLVEMRDEEPRPRRRGRRPRNLLLGATAAAVGVSALVATIANAAPAEDTSASASVVHSEPAVDPSAPTATTLPAGEQAPASTASQDAEDEEVCAAAADDQRAEPVIAAGASDSLNDFASAAGATITEALPRVNCGNGAATVESYALHFEAEDASVSWSVIPSDTAQWELWLKQLEDEGADVSPLIIDGHSSLQVGSRSTFYIFDADRASLVQVAGWYGDREDRDSLTGHRKAWLLDELIPAIVDQKLVNP